MTKRSIAKESDEAQLYSSCLAELIALRNDFSRAKWQLRLADTDEATRLAFSLLRARIEISVQTLTNARLSDIAAKLRSDGSDLRKAIATSRGARTHFAKVERALSAHEELLARIEHITNIAEELAGLSGDPVTPPPD